MVPGGAFFIAISPDCCRVALYHWATGKLFIWDIQSTNLCFVIYLDRVLLTNPLFFEKGSYWMAAFWDMSRQELAICNLDTGKCSTSRPQSLQQIRIRFSGTTDIFWDGESILVAQHGNVGIGQDEEIEIWNITKERLICKVRMPEYTFGVPNLTDDGQYLTAQMWNKDTRERKGSSVADSAERGIFFKSIKAGLVEL